MKKFSWLLAFLMLLSAPKVHAQSCDPCCDPCNLLCDCDYSVYADYLYWEVCTSDLDTGDDEYVNPGYDHGFRVGGNINCDCWDLGLRYTYYYNESEKNDDKFKFDYDVVDIELGYTFNLDCVCASFRPFAGAKLAWIWERWDDDKMDAQGYGLTFGTDAKWHLCNYCFCDKETEISLIGRGSYGILHTGFKRNSRDRECLYIRYLDAFVALNFGFSDCCGCFDGDLAIGYEVQHWGDWREPDSNDDIATLGLGGLVLRLGLNF